MPLTDTEWSIRWCWRCGANTDHYRDRPPQLRGWHLAPIALVVALVGLVANRWRCELCELARLDDSADR